MREKSNIIVGVAMSLFTAVGIFLLFLTMFSNGKFGMERGSGYAVIFGTAQGGSLNPVPLLIVAFVVECVAILGAIVGAALVGKAQGIALGATGILLIACAIAFLFSVPLYKNANMAIISENAESLELGAAPICNAIFAIIAGVLGLYGGYKGFKAQ